MTFAAWGQMTGGSFLATERRLSQSVARLPSANANHARLALARFYLANRFAAEALGLINLIQAQDPALAGDAQLATMRAAADYMMGRYRDAHNDLAGGNFDFDPPCRPVARPDRSGAGKLAARRMTIWTWPGRC